MAAEALVSPTGRYAYPVGSEAERKQARLMVGRLARSQLPEPGPERLDAFDTVADALGLGEHRDTTRPSLNLGVWRKN